MAKSSHYPSPLSLPILYHLFVVKLNHENFLPWKAQIIPYLKDQNLFCFLDGTHTFPNCLLKILENQSGLYIMAITRSSHYNCSYFIIVWKYHCSCSWCNHITWNLDYPWISLYSQITSKCFACPIPARHPQERLRLCRRLLLNG